MSALRLVSAGGALLTAVGLGARALAKAKVSHDHGRVLGLEVIDTATPEIVRMQKAIDDLDDIDVYVGVRGTKGSDLVMAAMANEFGTRHIPERSFLRSTMDRRKQRYAFLLEQSIDRGLDGETMKEHAEQIGAIAVGDVQRTMTELRHPPNAPSTIKRKGSANPLIDTGRLRQSIDAVVEVGGVVSRTA